MRDSKGIQGWIRDLIEHPCAIPWNIRRTRGATSGWSSTRRTPAPPVTAGSRAQELEATLYTCPHCQHHFRLTAWERIRITADEGVFQELSADIETANPLEFPDYEKKLAAAAQKTGIKEAVVTGLCKVDGHEVVLAVMDFRFIGGSMGVGGGREDHARHAGGRGEEASHDRLHLVGRGAHAGGDPLPHADGQDRRGHAGAGKGALPLLRGPDGPHHGGRARVLRHAGRRDPRGAGGPHAVRRRAGGGRHDPGEGARELPAFPVPLRAGLHRHDRAPPGDEEEAGLPPEDARRGRREGGHEREPSSGQDRRAEGPGGEAEHRHQPRAGRTLRGASSAHGAGRKAAENEAWRRVELARHPERPTTLQYAEKIFDDFIELHGDRTFGDDPALVGRHRAARRACPSRSSATRRART